MLQSANLYAFVMNNPLRWRDPTGLFAELLMDDLGVDGGGGRHSTPVKIIRDISTVTNLSSVSAAVIADRSSTTTQSFVVLTPAQQDAGFGIAIHGSGLYIDITSTVTSRMHETIGVGRSQFAPLLMPWFIEQMARIGCDGEDNNDKS